MFHRAARQRLSYVLSSNTSTARVAGTATVREPRRYAAAEALNLRKLLPVEPTPAAMASAVRIAR
jgi:hypothetical protein